MGNALGPAIAPPPRPQGPWEELRDQYAQVQTKLQQQLTNRQSVAIYETLGSHLVDATTGGVVFWLGISATQLLQRGIRVGAGTPVVPRVIGTIAVASSSVMALHFASFPREIVDAFWIHQSVGTTPSTVTTTVATSKTVYEKVCARVRDLETAPLLVYAAMGVLSFKMLGGRMTSLAPSHYAHPGAFHLRKASLPATEDYAGTSGRMVMQELGRLYGCHTCGVKRGVQFHADHMPPKLFATRMNEVWWRQWSGRKVKFRFFPQCKPCSNAQSSDVKMARNELKLHVWSQRLYHSTGFWLVLLCTGGLYVGGSSFHETADVHPPLAANATTTTTTTTDDGEDELRFSSVSSSSSSDHALLVSLREREKKIRKQRRQCARSSNDVALVEALDAELRSIDECKRRLKDTMKRTTQQQRRV